MKNQTIETNPFVQALGAGFLATLTMTIVMYPLAGASGLPSVDVAEYLTLWSPWSWWTGMLEHFAIGSLIFPLLFMGVLWGARQTAIPPVLLGVLFGVSLWFIFQAAFAPLVGLGFFSFLTPHPVGILFVTFNGHLGYGLLLGLTAPKIKQQEVSREERLKAA